MTHDGDKFMAEWYDLAGKRHRQWFAVKDDCVTFETRQRAKRFAMRLGQRIRRATKGQDNETAKLARECARITLDFSLGRQPPAPG